MGACLPVDEHSRPEQDARSDGRLQVAQSQRLSSEGQGGGVDYSQVVAVVVASGRQALLNVELTKVDRLLDSRLLNSFLC